MEAASVSASAAPDWRAVGALGVALFSVSVGSIFFVAAGREMSPNAIALNRLSTAAIAFTGLNGIQALRQPAWISKLRETNPPKASDWLLLLTAGACFALSLGLLA